MLPRGCTQARRLPWHPGVFAPSAIPFEFTCPRCEVAHEVELDCPAGGETATCVSRPILLDTPVPLDPLLETRVGNFVLKRRLGEGGMGAVYLGENPAIGSKVAVKFLHPSLARDPAIVRRFYDEARAANLVAHENIVRVLDLGHDVERGFHLIMEYVPGQTLAARLGQGPVPLAWAEQVLAQLCSALGNAHALGVVHRDLKPENILLVEGNAGPYVKIADFGIAKLRAQSVAGATALGDMLGTPAYMSPEQCHGAPADSRADIYALGVMAYELCTGQLPFSGNVARLLVAHIS
jgi:eukaryotic-like serine/threonine-protein kinase